MRTIRIMMTAVALVAAGCSHDSSVSKDKAKVSGKTEASETTHSGWWCAEHGVPEHMCSLCSAKVEARCKKEGDWCKLHDRALSQCFKCDPSKYTKFEQLYVAKYSKKPPRPPEEEFEK